MFDLFRIFRREHHLEAPDSIASGELDEMLAEDIAPYGSLSKTASKKLQEARKSHVSPSAMTVRSTDRLPPGQHLVTSFPVLDIGILPNIDIDNWRLDVKGDVASETTLDWAAISRLEFRDSLSDFHCVTGWSRFDNHWRGVKTASIASLCVPLPSARFVLLHGADGYTTNLPIEDFLHPDALLATEWDGKALEQIHGGPVRAVVPHLYGWKSAKWIVGIEFLAEQKSGFWEVGGYHDRGDPWLGHRFKWNDAAYNPWSES